jgi:hypothetical protein
VPTLESFGFKNDLARLYAEMTAAVTSGHVRFEGGHRSVESTEPLEQTLRALLDRNVSQ